MALYNAPRDPRIDLDGPVLVDRPARYGGGWFPLILAALISTAILAMFYPRSLAVVGDSTSFSKVQIFAPGPVPVTERRPAPAPI
jgi:hypothetical protein